MISNHGTMNILHHTSSCIFIPALIATYLGRWPDVFVNVLQGTASVWYHNTHSPIALVFDRISLALLAARTIYLASTSLTLILLYILGFGYIGVIYLCGRRYNCFAFHPNQFTSDMYHASMHILGIAIYSGSMIWLLD